MNEECFEWFINSPCVPGSLQTAGAPAKTDGTASESSDTVGTESESEEDEGVEEQYFAVRARAEKEDSDPVERDIIESRCRKLRNLMRERPTLPLGPGGAAMTAADLETGMKLPLYSCPFQNNERGPCQFHTSDRTAFLHHVAGGAMDRAHAVELQEICKDDISWMTNLDYVHGALSVAERERWPLLGLSTTRRSLNLLALRYNDSTTQCLACFICGQLRTTCAGYPPVDLGSGSASPAAGNVEIHYWKEATSRTSRGSSRERC